MCNTDCDFDDASLLTDAPEMMETAESDSSTLGVEEAEEEAEEDEEESLEGVGKMIQDLAHSDNAKVNAALDALTLDVRKGIKMVTLLQLGEVALPWSIS
jgi:hypothetical protein